MSTRRRLLAMNASAVAVGAVLPVGAGVSATMAKTPDSPDADLIRICAEHPGLIAAYNSGPDGGTLDYDTDPLWLAYERSRDFITNAKPRTMAGMVAKAKAAKAEAIGLDGGDNPEGTPAETWAWDLVNDLLAGSATA